MEEKVDILLATYNGEKYVAEQIESILNQTYKNFNLIISDDCSKDSTPDVLKKYAESLFKEVTRDEPEYGEAQRMLSFLRFIDSIEDDDQIVNNSIIREFIGGSILVK